MACCASEWVWKPVIAPWWIARNEQKRMQSEPMSRSEAWWTHLADRTCRSHSYDAVSWELLILNGFALALFFLDSFGSERSTIEFTINSSILISSWPHITLMMRICFCLTPLLSSGSCSQKKRRSRIFHEWCGASDVHFESGESPKCHKQVSGSFEISRSRPRGGNRPSGRIGSMPTHKLARIPAIEVNSLDYLMSEIWPDKVL